MYSRSSNWLKDDDNHFTKTLRGYTAGVTVAGDGTATLTIAFTGDGDAPVAAPDDTTYDTIKNAKNAFRKFLHDVPVS